MRDGIFTSTSSDLTTGAGGWRATQVAITATGLIFITLAITYLIPVASAAAGDPLPPSDLEVLRKAGIPVVADDEFAAALDRQRDRRCLLTGLLRDDGCTEESWGQWRAGSTP